MSWWKESVTNQKLVATVAVMVSIIVLSCVIVYDLAKSHTDHEISVVTPEIRHQIDRFIDAIDRLERIDFSQHQEQHLHMKTEADRQHELEVMGVQAVIEERRYGMLHTGGEEPGDGGGDRPAGAGDREAGAN